MRKSFKILFASTSIVAATAGIVSIASVASSNASLNIEQTAQPDRKYFFDNKYFNSMEEVTSYYLFKNDIVDSDFFFGSVNEALYDYTNGFLDATKLYPVDYTKTSNAYTNAYGGYEKTKQAALDTFINETRMVTKYSDYNGGLFYEYDQALDSLRSKTKDYKLVHSKINLNGESININPLNVADQNELKQIAFNEVMANKQGTPFQFSYYYDDPAVAETLTGLNELSILGSLPTIIDTLKNEIFRVFQNNIRYKGTVKAHINGVAEYAVNIHGSQTNRTAVNWQSDGDWPSNNTNAKTREIYIHDLTPAEVNSLSMFENTYPGDGSAEVIIYDKNSNCCGVNNVTQKRRIRFGNGLNFDFYPTAATLNWYHSKHGFWFGPGGYECGVIHYTGNNGMTFKASAQPSYLFKQNGQRLDLSNWNSSLEKMMETYAFILDIAFENLFKSKDIFNQNFDSGELNFIADVARASMLNVFEEKPEAVFSTQLNGVIYGSESNRFKVFYNNSSVKKDFEGSNYLGDRYTLFNAELIYTLSELVKPIITYNQRPLYEINFYDNLTQEEKEINKEITKNRFKNENLNGIAFHDILLYIYDNIKNSFNPIKSLINISQNVKPNIQINNNDQLSIYKQNQFSNDWIDSFEGFVPVALPSIAVDGVGNRITNIKSGESDQYYFNNMVYHHLQNKNIINKENLENIPLLYGLNGDPELYISSYLGNSFDNDASLSQAALSLYANEYSLLRAKQNLNSLKPSKVHLVIGPNGKPLPIGSSPGSDGFYNSFENVLVNAGFEFSLKPSEKFIFYEDKLISNDFNLIYNLNIRNKVLYFADYTKLTYYVQELLKLEVEVI